MSCEPRGQSASGRAGGRRPPKSGKRDSPAQARPGDRGQTTLDFAIGVSVFLSVMLFVFAFVPGILQPFNLSGEADTALSERVASDLSQGMLGNATQPYVLESTCAVQFFDEGDSPPGFCNYEGQTVHERLGVSEIHNLNVTMEGALDGGLASERVCWDSNSEDLIEAGSADCGDDSSDVNLAIGGVPPESNDATVTARRIVSLHQQNLTMKVVVW